MSVNITNQGQRKEKKKKKAHLFYILTFTKEVKMNKT